MEDTRCPSLSCLNVKGCIWLSRRLTLESTVLTVRERVFKRSKVI
jgi:hypothetical protein